MIDFKRDTIESAVMWTGLQKDVAAVHGDSIKFLSTGMLEFAKMTVQSLIFINAGALTIVPAIVKIVHDAPTADYRYFFIALGAFSVGLIFGVLCSYASYVQYNFDLGEKLGIIEREIEFFKSTKEITDNVSFVRYDPDRYSVLVKYIDKNRKNSSNMVYITRVFGFGSAVFFIIGSIFSASHLLKIELSRFFGFWIVPPFLYCFLIAFGLIVVIGTAIIRGVLGGRR